MSIQFQQSVTQRNNVSPAKLNSMTRKARQ